MSADSGDLPRRTLEALGLEEFKRGRLTERELQSLLGFGTRYKLGGFLKEHGVLVEDYTADDIHREAEVLERLGF